MGFFLGSGRAQARAWPACCLPLQPLPPPLPQVTMAFHGHAKSFHEPLFTLSSLLQCHCCFFCPPGPSCLLRCLLSLTHSHACFFFPQVLSFSFPVAADGNMPARRLSVSVRRHRQPQAASCAFSQPLLQAVECHCQHATPARAMVTSVTAVIASACARQPLPACPSSTPSSPAAEASATPARPPSSACRQMPSLPSRQRPPSPDLSPDAMSSHAFTRSSSSSFSLLSSLKEPRAGLYTAKFSSFFFSSTGFHYIHRHYTGFSASLPSSSFSRPSPCASCHGSREDTCLPFSAEVAHTASCLSQP